MNFRIQIHLLQFLALAACLVWLCTAFAAKPIKVEGVNPNVAAPSDEKSVVISGSGFNDTNVVEFFFTGEAEVPENSEISVVEGSVKSNGRGTELTVTIIVDPLAAEKSYDIVVRSYNRRGKGTDLFRVEQKAGGNVLPTYDVTFDGDLANSYGDMWQSDSQQDSITYFASDPQGGSGYMDLSFFQNGAGGSGPFSGTDGKNCFIQSTPISAVQFFPDKNDDAVLKGSFIGFSLDPAITRTFVYHFTLTGTFTDPGNWLPQDPEVSATVTITDWRLKLKSKREDRLYSDITCTGTGTIAATIGVTRND